MRVVFRDKDNNYTIFGLMAMIVDKDIPIELECDYRGRRIKAGLLSRTKRMLLYKELPNVVVASEPIPPVS